MNLFDLPPRLPPKNPCLLPKFLRKQNLDRQLLWVLPLQPLSPSFPEVYQCRCPNLLGLNYRIRSEKDDLTSNISGVFRIEKSLSAICEDGLHIFTTVFVVVVHLLNNEMIKDKFLLSDLDNAFWNQNLLQVVKWLHNRHTHLRPSLSPSI